MAYSLYVNGAQEFLPEFNRQIFETSSGVKAIRAGRQQMWPQNGRVCAKGRYLLEDWLVPVIYQQDPPDLAFVSGNTAHSSEKTDILAVNSKTGKSFSHMGPEEDTYGFIGRDAPLLDMERGIRGQVPAILIHGLGGVGKTSLAAGFLRWLSATQGLANKPIWIGFNDVRSFEFVINRMGEIIGLDTRFLALKIDGLAQILKEKPFVIVWDNFEVAQSIPGTTVDAALSSRDRDYLKSFLSKIRKGKSRIIITSRGNEKWLRPNCRKISLGGLEGEERWENLDRIASALNLAVDRKDENLATLMDMLGGHPLSMQVILPNLESHAPLKILNALKTKLETFSQEGDEAGSRLYAILIK